MGWGPIRVWNDDEISPNSGFPPHPHADMEIVTYVREGAITHEDSLGNRGRTDRWHAQLLSCPLPEPARQSLGYPRSTPHAEPSLLVSASPRRSA